MHHQVGFDRVLLRSRPRVDEQVVALPLDGRDGHIKPDLDAEFPGRLHQLGDQVRIKLLEGTASPVEHLDAGPGTRRDVRELERDVATADEDNTRRQVIKFQKLRAGGQEFLARYPKPGVLRAGRDHHVATGEDLIAHLDGRAVDEAGPSMPHRDSRPGEAAFGALWHWIGEGALEADQIWPAEGQARRGDTLALHAPAPVHE